MGNRGVPVVSIVGRPNVGKSSLFNRIAGKRHAVVGEREGTTRDRIEKRVEIKGKSLVLVDTGGFMLSGGSEIYALVKKQVEKAVGFSDILLLLCDGASGLLPLDTDLARKLRKSGKKIVLAVNKIDNKKMEEENLFDFYRLGLGEPFGVSCLHGRGMKKLFNGILDFLPDSRGAETEKSSPIKVAIVGRPNVGKSSFLNEVLKEERAIVHEKPGTTRDCIDTYFTKDGISFLLIDTAGMRHKRKVPRAVDIYSMMRARDSIGRSDVALLLVDGMDGITADDIKIFNHIRESGRGLAIIVNKWDLVKGAETSRYESAVIKRIPEARNFPVAFVSAKTGRGVLKAFNLAPAIKSNGDLFIDDRTLKEFTDEVKPGKIAAPRRGTAPRFYRITQSGIFPKEFSVFVNDTRSITPVHSAFIENRLRERFPLLGVPVRIRFKRFPRKKDRKRGIN